MEPSAQGYLLRMPNAGGARTPTAKGRDALALLKEDHRTAEALFRRFERAGQRAHKQKRRLVDQIIRELSVHADIEEQVFYPAVRERVQAADDEVLESLEEHHIVKWTLSELEDMDPTDERFDAKVRVLIENVRHHMKEEESEMFPRVRAAVKPADRREIGLQLAGAKRVVSRRPHPRMPDQPPGNLLGEPVALALDAAKGVVDTARRAAGRRGRGDAERE